MEKPKILNTELACASALFRVEQVDLRFSNGEERRYERLMGGKKGAVLVVPLISATEVLMVREYGVGVEDYQLSFLKGRVEKDEDILDAANREMQEEAGYAARKLHLLKTISQSPNYMQHHTHIIVAEDLYPQTLPGDEPEPLIVERYALSEIDNIVMQDDLTEARSIAAFYLVRAWLKKKDVQRGAP